MVMTIPTAHSIGVRDERDVVHRAMDGDPAAQRVLYDRYVDRIYRMAFRLAGDADTASDLTQETFIHAFDKLGDFRHEAAFGTWLHRIAITVVLGALRKQKRREVHHVALDYAAEVGRHDRNSDPDLRSRLHGAIDALPVGYRTVFVMYEVEGYTHQEIADALGVQVTTSKGQLFRAKAKLRDALKQFAGDERQ